MKKNKMMRLASALLVLVLLTTCAISGTFAKYVTTGGSSDSARVAKWGVTVTADYDSLFAETYKGNENDEDNTDDLTVVSSVQTKAAEGESEAVEGQDVVAPGTSGTLADFTVTGTPEVDVEVTYTATLTLIGWNIPKDESSAEDYCPIIFTVNGVDYYVGKTITETDGDNMISNSTELAAVVKAAIEGSAKYYNANNDLGDEDDGVAADLAVSWRWEFEGEATDATLSSYQTDKKDTALGDAANAATIELEVSCSITQVD